MVTDESGEVVENTSYSPYGEILSGGEATRYDYEGKEYDSTTGSYDFHFRGYNPEWVLFTQPDSLLPNVYDPQQLNRYMFERGNPYKYTDEDGHFVAKTFFTGLAMAAIGVGLLVTAPVSVPLAIAATFVGVASIATGVAMTGFGLAVPNEQANKAEMATERVAHPTGWLSWFRDNRMS